MEQLESVAFLDIASNKDDLDELINKIKCGSLGHAKAMEVAMYSVGYATTKCEEASAIYLKRTVEEDCNERIAAKEAGAIFDLATNNVLVAEALFKQYPLAQKVLSGMFYVIEHYKASTVTYPALNRASAVSRKNQSTYFLLNPLTSLIKIGKSVDVMSRKKILECGSGVELEVLHVINEDIESQMHKKFAKYRESGEWFNDKDGVIAQFISNPMVGV